MVERTNQEEGDKCLPLMFVLSTTTSRAQSVMNKIPCSLSHDDHIHSSNLVLTQIHLLGSGLLLI